MRLIPCRATLSALIMVTSHDCDGSDGVTRLSDGCSDDDTPTIDSYATLGSRVSPA